MRACAWGFQRHGKADAWVQTSILQTPRSNGEQTGVSKNANGRMLGQEVSSLGGCNAVMAQGFAGQLAALATGGAQGSGPRRAGCGVQR